MAAVSEARLSTALRKVNVPRIWWLFVAMVAVLAVTQPIFLNLNNLTNVSVQLSVKGILALGMTAVILCGEIDLSAGSVLCLTGLFTAAVQRAGLGIPLSILVGLGTGALIGLINGVLVVKRNLPSFMVTMATMIAARGVGLVYSKGIAILGVDTRFMLLGQGSVLGIPIATICFAVLAVAFHLLLTSTTFGVRLYSTGSNREAATFSGIRTDNVRIWVFVLMGITSAISGFVLTARLAAAGPNVGELYELDAIAAVVIGGTLFAGGAGGVSLTLPGIFILGIISNALNLFRVSPFFHYYVQGAVIILSYVLRGIRFGRAGRRAGRVAHGSHGS